MIAPDRPLLLASASPRRRELLERVGLPIAARAVDVDESVEAGESAPEYLERVVNMKRRAAGSLVELGGCAGLVVADTVVVAGGAILGKPRSDAEALAMLGALAGTVHRVSTRFCIEGRDGRVLAQTVDTQVWFRDLDEAQRSAYVASGEGRDKAGAYAIQGIGALLVRRIEGSYSNVVGLPLCEVVEGLEALGLLPSWPVFEAR